MADAVEVGGDVGARTDPDEDRRAPTSPDRREPDGAERAAIDQPVGVAGLALEVDASDVMA